jgi:hypothetical protein
VQHGTDSHAIERLIMFHCVSVSVYRRRLKYLQQSLFGSAFGPNANLDLVLTGVSHRKTVSIEQDDKVQQLYIYSNGDNVDGELKVHVVSGKKLEHVGIKVELKGVVDTFGDKAQTQEFVSTVRELAVPGVLQSGTHVSDSMQI